MSDCAVFTDWNEALEFYRAQPHIAVMLRTSDGRYIVASTRAAYALQRGGGFEVVEGLS